MNTPYIECLGMLNSFLLVLLFHTLTPKGIARLSTER